MKNLTVCLLSVVFYSGYVFAETPLGIDMSYRSVFKQYGVPENDTVAKFFRDTDDGRDYVKDMVVPSDFFNSYTPRSEEHTSELQSH